MFFIVLDLRLERVCRETSPFILCSLRSILVFIQRSIPMAKNSALTFSSQDTLVFADKRWVPPKMCVHPKAILLRMREKQSNYGSFTTACYRMNSILKRD